MTDLEPKPTPGAWIRLSGYGVLVALLEIGIAVFFALDPRCFAGSDVGQCIPSATYVWHAGYFVGGVALLASLIFRRTDVEVCASLILIASNVMRTLYGFAYTVGLEAARPIAVSVFLIIGVSLRVSALLAGGTFHIPAWRLHRRRRA